MKINKTNRGFSYVEFTDRYGMKCSLQKSSLATEDAIWLGIDNPKPKIIKTGEGWIDYLIPDEVFISTRMHLTQEQVRELLPYLQRFVETGEINESAKEWENENSS